MVAGVESSVVESGYPMGAMVMDQAESGVPEAEDCWRRNMAALARHHSALHARLGQADATSVEKCPLLAAEPWPGVQSHLDTVQPGAQGLVVFLGMGLGYGPLLVLQQRPEVAQFAILEPSLDLFCAALASVDLRPLLTDSRVVFFVGEINYQALEAAVIRVAYLEDTHILRHVPSFQWRPEVYGPLNDRAYMLLNQINASGSTTRQCGRIFMENRFSSLTLLRHAHSIDALRGLLQGKPAVVVAAGPSLAQSLPALRQMIGRCAVIAADSALAPLLRAGIVPDIVTSIDYLDLNFEKVAPFLGREWPFSLVTLAKATPLVSKRFPARHLFLAYAEDLPQQWIVEALGIKAHAPTCGSVAHLSLGMALMMGCSPVVFVGQDLSYTNASLDHADGTIIMRRDLPQDREIFMVPAVGGGKVPTDRQFLSLMKTFSDIIEGWPRHYINASAAGVRIRGTMEMLLAEVASLHAREAFSVEMLMDEAIAAGPGFDEKGFVLAARERSRLVLSMRGKMKEVLALGGKARRQLARLVKAGKEIRGLSDLSVSLRDILARFDALNGEIDKEKPLWDQMVELTFGLLGDNDRFRQRNDQLRTQVGYLPWLSAEIERIDRLNHDREAVRAQYATILETLLEHLDAEEKLGLVGDCPARQELAALHLRAGDYLLARRMLDTLPLASRQQAEMLLLSGEAKAGMLDFAGADADWGRALAEKPSLGKQIERLRRRFCDEWLGCIDRYANPGEGGDNFPHLLPVWLERIMGAAGNREAAVALLRPLFDRHCGRVEELLGQVGAIEAEEVLSAWRLVFSGAPLCLLLARCLAARGDNDGALAWVGEALEAEPGNLEGLSFLVRTLLKAGRFQEGIARLEAAVLLNPQVALVWEEIGDMLFSETDHAGAVMAYEKCFLALPDRLEPLLKMGQAYHKKGSLPAAKAAYEAVLARDPAHPVAKQSLVEIREAVR